MNLSHPLHAENLLKSLNECRKDAALCDGVLVVGKSEIPIQKYVLAAASPYLRGLYSYGNTCPSKSSVHKLHLDLPMVSAPIFECILDYIYTSEIELSESNIQDMLQAADVLLMSDLKELCCEYLEQCISTHNCLGILEFAERYSCPRVHHKAISYLEEYFSEISYSEEYLNLPQEKLKVLLQRNNLQVAGEQMIYDCLMRWVRHDECSRLSCLQDLLSTCINFGLLDQTFMNEHLLLDELVQKTQLSSFLSTLKISPENVPQPRGYTHVLVVSGGEGLIDWDPCTSELKRQVHCIRVQNEAGTEVHKWIQLAPLTRPRAGHGFVEAGGNLYVVGGRDDSGRILNTGEKYNPIDNTWTPITPMSHARVGFGLVTIDDKIYAIGGSNDMSDPLTSMEEYNIYTNRWRRLPEMNLKRAWAAFAVCNKKIYVIGGGIMGKLYESVECYDPRSESWTSTAPMKERRFDARAVGCKDHVYVFGGLRRLECPSAFHNNSTGMKFCGTELYSTDQKFWASLSRPDMNPNNYLCTMTESSRLYSSVTCGEEILVVGELDIGDKYNAIRAFNPLSNRWREVVEDLPPGQRNMPACILKMPNHVLYKHLWEQGLSTASDCHNFPPLRTPKPPHP